MTMTVMRSLLFVLLCSTIFYCNVASWRIDLNWTKEDPKLAQKTMELKQQAVNLMKLRGHKIATTEVKKEAVWGDIQITWGLYKYLKAKMDEQEQILKNGGGSGKAVKNRHRGSKMQQNTSSRLMTLDFEQIPDAKWTESDMPIKYTLLNTYTYGMKSEIRRALKEIENKVGCITFQEVGYYPYGPFINFVEQRGLSYCGRSPLGKDSRVNTIILDNECPKFGTILHETLHSLGFAHTQQRPDADQYLWFNWNNIQPYAKFNFLPLEYALQNQGRFDYGSIMMYNRNAFAINSNQDTIIPRYNPAVNKYLMGQRKGLSSEDVNMMRQMYCTRNPGSRRNNGGGSGGITIRRVRPVPRPGPVRPSGRGFRTEALNTRKVSEYRCYRSKTEILPCQGVRVCDLSGTYEGSCSWGLYFQNRGGRYFCTTDRGKC